MSTKGGVPGNNPIMDIIYWIGSGVSGPLASHLRGRTLPRRLLGLSGRFGMLNTPLMPDWDPAVGHSDGLDYEGIQERGGEGFRSERDVRRPEEGLAGGCGYESFEILPEPSHRTQDTAYRHGQTQDM